MKDDRLANTVLYLLHGCKDRPGLTKLLKLVYHADYHHYREHLATITGAGYVALQRGPVLHSYEERLEELERRGFVSTREVKVVGHDKPKREYIPLMEADPEAFSKAELATLDDVLLKYGSKSGAVLSEMTHEEALPWSFAWNADHPGASIPTTLFRWLDNLADERDIEVAKNRLESRTKS